MRPPPALGPIDGSWRQQPGASAYCTDLTLEELPAALGSTDRARTPARRDLIMTVIGRLLQEPDPVLTPEVIVRVNRALSA